MAKQNLLTRVFTNTMKAITKNSRDKQEEVAPSRAISWSNGYTMSSKSPLGIQKSAGGVDFRTLRRIASLEPIVANSINIIKKGVSQAPWKIKKHPLAKEMDMNEYKRAYDFFTYINPDGENLRILLDRTIEDLLSLDAGVWEVLKNFKGEVIGLNSVDGATIRFRVDEYGQGMSYVQVVNGKQAAEFSKEDLIYIMANPQNDVDKYPYGQSPIERILLVVQSSLNAEHSNANMFSSDNVPAGILNLGKMFEHEAEAAIAMWNAQVVGNTHSLKFMFGPDKIDFLDFKRSNRDMQYIEYLDRLTRIILATFGLSAMDLNIVQDINRSTAGAQTDKTNKGVQSVKHLVQETINTKLFTLMGFETIIFEFDTVLTPEERLTQAKVDEIYTSKTGIMTVDEIRAREGLEPFGVSNQINEMSLTPEEDSSNETQKRFSTFSIY